MKLRNPLLLRFVALLGALVIRLWMSTVRYRIDFGTAGRHPPETDRERFIYAFWHESLLFATKYSGRFYALISQHADGELLARLCSHLGIGSVRGSTNHGGGQALFDMLRCGRSAHLAVTPDGPRGPRRRVQLGVVFMASRAAMPIVVVGIGFSRAWRARSWDRFAVPLPFSTLYCKVGGPIVVPGKLRREGLEQYRLLVETQLQAVTDDAESWANRACGRPSQAAAPRSLPRASA
jgi:lysophospholipid acyltransferase (LPLAT)-like uncharacterized protein